MIIKQHYEEYKRNIYRSQHTAYRWSFMRYIPAEHWTPITSCFEQFPEPIVNDAYHTHVALDAGCHKQQLFCKFFFLRQKERPPGAAPLPRRSAGPGRPRRAPRDNGASTAALTISPRPGGPPAAAAQAGRTEPPTQDRTPGGRLVLSRAAWEEGTEGARSRVCCCCLGLGAGRPPTLQHLSCLFPSVAGPPAPGLSTAISPGRGPAGLREGRPKPTRKRDDKAWPASALPPKFVCPLLLAKLPSLWSKTLY